MRPWVVGFWDQKSGSRAVTKEMKLNLVSGAPVSEKKKKGYFDIPKPFKRESTDELKTATYAFSALSSEKKCVVKTRCSGWDLEGTYKVFTTGNKGKSGIEMTVRLSPPTFKKFNLNSMFGVSWSVGYTKHKTETFLTFWHPTK